MSDLPTTPGSDNSRFTETGEGFVLLDLGNEDEDLPVFDWDQNDPETITPEGND